MVKLDMYPCKHNENCLIKLKDIIEDVIGVSVSRVDGGCGESLCSIVFKEGVIGGIEKRVHSISKHDSDPVGDSYVISEINQNRYLIALCDGMGSGKKASVISSSVVSLLVEMLKAGFSEEATIKMINSFLIANLSGETFSTVDFIVVDTKKMTGKIVKNGACPTYIKKSDGEVTEIQNQSMPAGITEQKPFIKNINLKKEDIIILVSDGTKEAINENDWIKNILIKLPQGALTDAVDLICGIAQRDFENREDDITVLGVKVV
jgi:stage II sporulation protein E